MIRRHPRLKIDVTKEAARAPIITSHPPTPIWWLTNLHYQTMLQRGTFSAPC
jgi:hypothetical protein